MSSLLAVAAAHVFVESFGVPPNTCVTPSPPGWLSSSVLALRFLGGFRVSPGALAGQGPTFGSLATVVFGTHP